MKAQTRDKRLFISIILALLLVVMMVVITISIAYQQPMNLGTTTSFAVLSGSTITNIGMTTIRGDVGLYPGVFFPGEASISMEGTLHLTDAAALLAKDDLVIAYNDIEDRSFVTQIRTELGGTTLTPGIYDSADGTFQITGTLILDSQGDAEGLFIFKTATTLNTVLSSSVKLINGTQSSRVFWKVGSSATLGANSYFVGSIYAMESITATTGGTVKGQLFARNGAVTLDNNTIINEIDETTPTQTPTSDNNEEESP